MKMMKAIRLFLLTIACLPLLCGCSDENNGGERIAICPFNQYVRFEDDEGSNLIEKMKLVEPPASGLRYADNDIIKVNCYRESDHKQQEFVNSDWLWLPTDNYLFDKSYGDTLGVVMRLIWFDDDLWDTDFEIEPREEVYVVELISPKIFKDEKPHTVKWFTHIYGRARYEAYRCEIDGRPFIPKTADSRLGWHHIYAALKFKVE